LLCVALLAGAPVARAVTVDGIAAYYADHGGASGPYGAALASETPGPDGGSVQHFSGGVILWSPATGTHGLLGPSAAKFDSSGGVSVLGYSTTEITPSHVVDGTWVALTGGAILSYQNGGGTVTHVLTHTAHHFLATGGYGSNFGVPLSDEFPLGHTGGTEAVGSLGRIYWSPATNAHIVSGEILARWADVHGVTGTLGFPLTDQTLLGGSSGSYVAFQGGDIFTAPDWGAHLVRGPILHAWQLLHRHGAYGFGDAVTDAYWIPGNQVVQLFERGEIDVDLATHHVSTFPEIR
jgi:uncharacterized protein with LGFP repeats